VVVHEDIQPATSSQPADFTVSLMLARSIANPTSDSIFASENPLWLFTVYLGSSIQFRTF
jgi:hypothetical protein